MASFFTFSIPDFSLFRHDPNPIDGGKGRSDEEEKMND
jgi:hypothetical protein